MQRHRWLDLLSVTTVKLCFSVILNLAFTVMLHFNCQGNTNWLSLWFMSLTGHNTEGEWWWMLYCCTYHARRHDTQTRSASVLFLSVWVFLLSVISYQNLFSACKLRHKMQSEAQPDTVLVVHVAAEVVCLEIWLEGWNCIALTQLVW